MTHLSLRDFIQSAFELNQEEDSIPNLIHFPLQEDAHVRAYYAQAMAEFIAERWKGVL